MIVMGASLGGTQAVQQILADLPASFGVPIGVVLHRHRDLSGGLVELLQRDSRLRVVEAVDKQPILAGHVFVAPADYHLLADKGHFALSVDEPVRFARPSVDVLFESAAAAYGGRVTGVVLTGGGADGARGAAAITAAGGVVLVQDPTGAACADMPAAALAATPAAEVIEIGEIAARLIELAK